MKKQTIPCDYCDDKFLDENTTEFWEDYIEFVVRVVNRIKHEKQAELQNELNKPEPKI